MPEAFFKVILWKNQTEASGVGFVLKHENSALPLKSYAITIDSVERVTGIDFFPLLADSVETVVESQVDTAKWFNSATVVPKKTNPQKYQKWIYPDGSMYFDLRGRKIKTVDKYRRVYVRR